MPILLLSIFLERSSIVAAAAKCFIFRKRTHSEVIYENTDSFNCSTKSYMEKADSWFKPKLSSHLHYFDARLFWVSSSPRKKFRLLHSSAETKTLFIVQISRSGSAALISSWLSVLSWGWHHAHSSAEKVYSRRLKAEPFASFSHCLCWVHLP